MKLSVLDLIPTRTAQTSALSLAASASQARLADALGYTRYWVAEHHNMPAVASSVPGVLIPFLAQGTSRIRFGSGGVMLPNHTPLAVAEQFALLEAMFPGRIDLGLGRAPGSDPVTSYLMRGGGADAAERFEQDVELLRELLGRGRTGVGEPVSLSLAGRPYEVRATPRATSAPDVWLLGSSGFSADLAARTGLPYVFANHFGMPGLERALATYRENYQPSDAYPEPVTILPVNVVAARDAATARRLARPQAVQMAFLRTGAPLRPQLTVEEAEAIALTTAQAELVAATSGAAVVGTPQEAAEQLRAMARRHGVDEVMISPAAGAFEADPLDRVPAREETLRLLAEELLA
ncbi:MsnO8 family LLM class oxidoreductase [Serinibacter salmoneus]|uniref:Luciferase family oxidoreductase group 1 n=1 Tax=Serinibacter salmoneus TaxID=556530 RepID=A0A2A9CZ42_9MICO|nr:MsnO8 family LLM class oxidoreductase [Serinibacter salmoneus]PFG19707.1 luciferase family oxidoreductase group 1 [Serinibacter salmoneus]